MMTGWMIGPDGWLLVGVWIVALVVAVGLLVWTPSRRSADKEPLELLRARLARGEITPDEFERARRLLEG